MGAEALQAIGQELRQLWLPVCVQPMPLMIKLQLCHLMRAEAQRAHAR